MSDKYPFTELVLQEYIEFVKKIAKKHSLDDLFELKRNLIAQRRLLENLTITYNCDGFDAKPFDDAIECINSIIEILL